MPTKNWYELELTKRAELISESEQQIRLLEADIAGQTEEIARLRSDLSAKVAASSNVMSSAPRGHMLSEAALVAILTVALMVEDAALSGVIKKYGDVLQYQVEYQEAVDLRRDVQAHINQTSGSRGVPAWGFLEEAAKVMYERLAE